MSFVFSFGSSSCASPAAPMVSLRAPTRVDQRVGVEVEHAAYLTDDLLLLGCEAVCARDHARRAHRLVPALVRDAPGQLRDVVVDALLLDRAHLPFDERRQAHRVEVVAEEHADAIGQRRELLLRDLSVDGGEEQAESDLRFDAALGHERVMLARPTGASQGVTVARGSLTRRRGLGGVGPSAGRVRHGPLPEQRGIARHAEALPAADAAEDDPIRQRSDAEHAELDPAPQRVFGLLRDLGVTAGMAAGALPFAHPRP